LNNSLHLGAWLDFFFVVIEEVAFILLLLFRGRFHPFVLIVISLDILQRNILIELVKRGSILLFGITRFFMRIKGEVQLIRQRGLVDYSLWRWWRAYEILGINVMQVLSVGLGEATHQLVLKRA